MYIPPFNENNRILNLVSEISDIANRISFIYKTPEHIELRRKNRIKTIHSSLAIENNSLSENQVTAIIDGKHVLGEMREIQEVQNAMKVYEKLMDFDPYNERDLLKAHSMMMYALVENAGCYRTKGVGVYDGKKIIHIAPPEHLVPSLMCNLFNWLKSKDYHPLVMSSIFHYEFEYIHPFLDGNGRMGRLWQTVILKEWNKLFAYVPLETLIKENQSEYYNVLRECDNTNNSTHFVEFILDLMLKTIKEVESSC